MNGQEFRELYSRHIVPAFPQIASWLFDGVSETEANDRRDLWLRVLDDVDLESAGEVVADIASGFVKAPTSWGDLATVIRAEVVERRERESRNLTLAERSAKYRSERQVERGDWSSVELFKRLKYRADHLEGTEHWPPAWDGDACRPAPMCEEERLIIRPKGVEGDTQEREA